MLDYKPNVVISTQEYEVVGTGPIRHDGPDNVTGRARYGADIQMSGLLHGKIRSPTHTPASSALTPAGRWTCRGSRRLSPNGWAPTSNRIVPIRRTGWGHSRAEARGLHFLRYGNR